MKIDEGKRSVFCIAIIMFTIITCVVIGLGIEIIVQDREVRVEYDSFIEDHSDYKVVYETQEVGKVNSINITFYEYRVRLIKIDDDNKIVYILEE